MLDDGDVPLRYTTSHGGDRLLPFSGAPAQRNRWSQGEAPDGDGIFTHSVEISENLLAPQSGVALSNGSLEGDLSKLISPLESGMHASTSGRPLVR